MKIIRAGVLGFCMGVRRAVDIALAEAGNNKGRIYTLGPLVHNPRVLSDLEKKGVKVSAGLECPEGSTCIIRAHGVRPEDEEDLKKRGCRVVDATCPKVKASQLKARELAAQGCCLFLAGEARHAEIDGIYGYAKSARENSFCEVVANAEAARNAAASLCKINPGAKTAVIGQTTISEEEYCGIASAIKEAFPGLLVLQTICAATKDRQNALYDLLTRTDAVIVAGGRESANTRRLFEIAESSGKPCVIAQSAEEIPKEFFSFDRVGLCAGASSPDAVIDEIEKRLTLFKMQIG